MDDSGSSPAPSGRGSEEPAAGTLVLTTAGPLTRADIPGLCERLRVLLLRGGDGPVTVDVGALTEPDLVAVEALARLQLTARRLGHRIRLDHAHGDLRRLLAWTGLDEETLPLRTGTGTDADAPPGPKPRSALQPGRKAEQREEARGVQERVDPDDPAP